MPSYQTVNSNNVYPFSPVVSIYVTYENGARTRGTGVVVGKNDVLTAAHVVEPDARYGAARTIEIVPGYDDGEAPFGSFYASFSRYYPTDKDGDGTLNTFETMTDYAILTVEQPKPIGDVVGWYGLRASAVSAGQSIFLNMIGYPSSFENADGTENMILATGTEKYDGRVIVHNYAAETGLDWHGASGSPLFVLDNGNPYVVGIFSTSGTATFVSSKVFNELMDWIDANDVTSGGRDGVRRTGGSGDDRLNGSGGPDVLIGQGGDDVLRGFGGGDLLYGNGGADRLVAGAGNDTMRGGAGADRLLGGGGRDKLFGQAGNDGLFGGPGNDAIYGGVGRDTLKGGAGTDRLVGHGGNDRLFGQKGDDFLIGKAGNDRMFGGSANDVLHGGDGRDVLAGGTGRDKLSGGRGADAFVFNKFAGSDTVTDFGGNDVVRIQSGAERMADLDFTDTQAGLLVEFGQVDIFFRGLDRHDLSASDFDFV